VRKIKLVWLGILLVGLFLVAGCSSEVDEEFPPGEDCIAEGGSVPVVQHPPECCEGLELIPPIDSEIVGSAGVCTSSCGNDICEEVTESEYNCAEDCPENI